MVGRLGSSFEKRATAKRRILELKYVLLPLMKEKIVIRLTCPMLFVAPLPRKFFHKSISLCCPLRVAEKIKKIELSTFKLPDLEQLKNEDKREIIFIMQSPLGNSSSGRSEKEEEEPEIGGCSECD